MTLNIEHNILWSERLKDPIEKVVYNSKTLKPIAIIRTDAQESNTHSLLNLMRNKVPFAKIYGDSGSLEILLKLPVKTHKLIISGYDHLHRVNFKDWGLWVNDFTIVTAFEILTLNTITLEYKEISTRQLLFRWLSAYKNRHFIKSIEIY